jgi:hypothetical protein
MSVIGTHHASHVGRVSSDSATRMILFYTCKSRLQAAYITWGRNDLKCKQLIAKIMKIFFEIVNIELQNNLQVDQALNHPLSFTSRSHHQQKIHGFLFLGSTFSEYIY